MRQNQNKTQQLPQNPQQQQMQMQQQKMMGPNGPKPMDKTMGNMQQMQNLPGQQNKNQMVNTTSASLNSSAAVLSLGALRALKASKARKKPWPKALEEAENCWRRNSFTFTSTSVSLITIYYIISSLFIKPKSRIGQEKIFYAHNSHQLLKKTQKHATNQRGSSGSIPSIEITKENIESGDYVSDESEYQEGGNGERERGARSSNMNSNNGPPSPSPSYAQHQSPQHQYHQSQVRAGAECTK
jgi:hypothetical protein